AQYLLGVSLMHLGRADEAIASWEGACKNAPNDASLRAALGFGYLKVGRAEEAGHTCAEAMKLGLRDADTLLNFGRLFERLKRKDDAVDAYKGVTAIDPDRVDAQKRLAAVLVELGRFQEAVDPWQQGLLANANDAEVRYGLGVCYANLGQKSAAKAQYEALKKLDATKAEELLFVIEE
ncbi:MAG: tetratricopeptide repeat protein, partial [Sandaracinaceae bacterium]|nr:tetratricopeptide repeat protein [Sandaracinaceae bacterium]